MATLGVLKRAGRQHETMDPSTMATMRRMVHITFTASAAPTVLQ
jgi:hypothetical protein